MSAHISEALGKLDLMIASAAGGSSNCTAGAVAPPAEGKRQLSAAAAADAIHAGSIKQRLAAAFQQSLDAAFPSMAGEPAIVVPCGNPKFGDYQCNNAMALHGKMKGKVRREAAAQMASGSAWQQAQPP